MVRVSREKIPQWLCMCAAADKRPVCPVWPSAKVRWIASTTPLAEARLMRLFSIITETRSRQAFKDRRGRGNLRTYALDELPAVS